MRTRNNQGGFTLIELIVVIVILGILAATALPKFVNFQDDANLAAAQGIAGGIASSASIRYAQNQISSTVTYTQAAACSGTYLQSSNFGACTAALAGAVCTVTCSTKTSSTTLP